MNDLEKLARRVRKHRASLGLSRESFAEKVGVSRATIYRIEAADAGVSVGNLLKVLHGLEMELEAHYRPKINAERLPKRPNVYQLMAME